jgi:hypothetical protein
VGIWSFCPHSSTRLRNVGIVTICPGCLSRKRLEALARSNGVDDLSSRGQRSLGPRSR